VPPCSYACAAAMCIPCVACWMLLLLVVAVCCGLVAVRECCAVCQRPLLGLLARSAPDFA
jgi:hypothetical protein